LAGQYLAFGKWGMSGKPSKLPTEIQTISKWFASGRNPISHGSVMFRIEWFNTFGPYDLRMKSAQDFLLFLQGFKLTNYEILDEVLYYYRKENPIPRFKYWRINEIHRELAIEIFRNSSSSFEENETFRVGKLKEVYFRLKYLSWRILTLLQLKN
jgi:hypothetical protein